MRRPTFNSLPIPCVRAADLPAWRRTTHPSRGPCLALAILLALAAPAAADAPIEDPGRRTATRPKLATAAIDGIPIALPAPAGEERPAPGRRLDARGRSLYARPTQPTVAGLIGCVGCQTYLRALGGLVVDAR